MPYLRLAVESVLAQTIRPDEIIVADDGSTDDSRAYLESLASVHSVVKPVLREQNLGVAMNRDLAVRSAKSSYITTLDGDDLYHPEKIEMELKVLDVHSDCVAYSNVVLIDAVGNSLKYLDFREFSRDNKIQQLQRLLYRQLPIPRDMLYSKALFEESGGYRHDLKLYEDWDLKLRLLNHAHEWRCTNQPGVGYRQHRAGLSTTDELTHLVSQLEVIMGNQGWLREAAGVEHIFNAILQRVVDNMGYRSAQLIK